MAKQSAGLIMYRRRDGLWEVLLVHPGGPFWAKKDEGAWSIPKGEYLDREDPLLVAKREFTEETGFDPQGEFLELAPVRQAGGKRVRAWAFAGECDPGKLVSNTFVMEWPPGSGREAEFPEVDRAEWFPLETARRKILKSQEAFILQLGHLLQRPSPE